MLSKNDDVLCKNFFNNPSLDPKTNKAITDINYQYYHKMCKKHGYYVTPDYSYYWSKKPSLPKNQLLSLPIELNTVIIKELSLDDLIILYKTSHFYQNLLNDKIILKELQLKYELENIPKSFYDLVYQNTYKNIKNNMQIKIFLSELLKINTFIEIFNMFDISYKRVIDGYPHEYDTINYIKIMNYQNNSFQIVTQLYYSDLPYVYNITYDFDKVTLLIVYLKYMGIIKEISYIKKKSIDFYYDTL